MFQNKLKKLIFFAALTLAAQQSQAVFLMTPSIGYKMQTIKLTDNADGEHSIKMSDPAYGLKLGFRSASGVGFDIAGDYTTGKSKSTTAGIEAESGYSHITAATQLSVSANVFKIYLGYVLMNEITFKSDTPGNGSKVKGTGYQAGVALSLTPALSLGAQYQIDQLNQINLESIGSYQDLKNYYKKVDSQSTTISLAYSF